MLIFFLKILIHSNVSIVTSMLSSWTAMLSSWYEKNCEDMKKIFMIKISPPRHYYYLWFINISIQFLLDTNDIFFTNNWFKMSRYYNRIAVANYRSKCSFCWQKTIKKRSHFGLLLHQGFTVLPLLWRFCEYLWREGSRPESPLFIGLPTLMWRVNPRFLLSHAYAKENKERKQQYG